MAIHASAALSSLIRAQSGLVTRGQLFAAGIRTSTITARASGTEWTRLFPGVFHVTGPLTDLVRIRAALMWAGDDAVACGGSAAYCWRMRTRAPDIVAISAPRRLAPQPSVRAILEPERDWVIQQGLRVTSIQETAIDLACLGSSDGLDWLARERRMNRIALQDALDRRVNRRGTAIAGRLLTATHTNPWSAAEREFHRLVLAAGITGWVANVPVVAGGERWIVDVRFDTVQLVIQIDGREHHDTAAAFETDRRQSAILAAAGWTVLRFTWRQLVNQPDWVVGTVRAALTRLAA